MAHLREHSGRHGTDAHGSNQDDPTPPKCELRERWDDGEKGYEANWTGQVIVGLADPLVDEVMGR